jgi:CDP-diacylglycerol pyrophosphatase
MLGRVAKKAAKSRFILLVSVCVCLCVCVLEKKKNNDKSTFIVHTTPTPTLLYLGHHHWHPTVVCNHTPKRVVASTLLPDPVTFLIMPHVATHMHHSNKLHFYTFIGYILVSWQVRSKSSSKSSSASDFCLPNQYSA